MSPARRAEPELDSLIEEITVDCYDEDEQLSGSEAPSTRTPASHALAASSAKKLRFSTSAKATADAN